MRKKFLYIAMMVAVAFTSCSDDGENAPDNPPVDPPNAEEPTDKPSNKPSETVSHLSFKGKEREANQIINEFSFRFFNATAAEWDKNGELYASASASPVSAAIYLTMLANSADDVTRDNIVKALGYSDVEVLNSVCKQLLEYLPNQEHHRVVMELANSIWYDLPYSIKPDYVEKMSDIFGAGIKPANFSTSEAAKEINQWANDATHGMIPKVVEEAPMSAKVFWANALYFMGEWDHKFDKTKTVSQPFYGVSGEQVAQMMNQEVETVYSSDNQFEMVCLNFTMPSPYSIKLLLPKGDIGISEASQALTYDEWQLLNASIRLAEVTLHLPRFKTYNQFSLNKVFAALGIDLSRVALVPMGIESTDPIYSFQTTATEIDEDGAKLADVSGGWGTAPGPQETIKAELTFDRPFLYVVENEETGSIIMAGRVANL